MSEPHTAKKQQTPYTFSTWLYQFLSGATIGLINATAVTPIINYNNHILAQKTHLDKKIPGFKYTNAFNGLSSYNMSYVLRISIAMSLNNLFMHKLEKLYGEVNDSSKLLSAIVAGGIAGSAASLSEAIAQTQLCQLSKNEPKLSSFAIIKEAYKCNGLFSLSRGMQAMMVRSAGVTTGALGLMPLCSQQIRQKMGDHPIAEVLSAIICGLIVGPMTTPPNELRFRMQENFIIKGSVPTYAQLIKNAYQSNMGLSHLFLGVKPRTAISIITMLIIAEGDKLCHLYSSDVLSAGPNN